MVRSYQRSLRTVIQANKAPFERWCELRNYTEDEREVALDVWNYQNAEIVSLRTRLNESKVSADARIMFLEDALTAQQNLMKQEQFRRELAQKDLK